MKVWRVLSGIISIVLYSVVDKQSRLAKVAEVLTKDEESKAASAGQTVALILLIGGILSIVLCKTEKKIAGIALAGMFGIAGAIGITNAGFYQDLYVWSGWCLICALMAVASMFPGKKKVKQTAENKENEDSKEAEKNS